MISTRATMVGGLGLGLLIASMLPGCGSTSDTPTPEPSTSGGTDTGGAGGVNCNPAPTLKCSGTAPASALISDFTIPDAGSLTVFGGWGQSIFGGLYVYPANPSAGDPCAGAAPQYPLTSDTSQGNWHITGQVGTYSGAGLWWECDTAATTPATTCTINGSAYTGISFTISGSLGGTGAIQVLVSTPGNTANPNDKGQATCGTCTASCSATAVQVPVSAAATTVTLTWAQLGVTDASAITGIAIALPDPYSYATNPAVATPYSVDITIDDLQFTT